MFICDSADVFVGHWSLHGAMVCILRRPGANDAVAGALSWGGSVVVPNWVSPSTLVGITAEICFDSGDVRQVVIEGVDRTLALFRGLGPPPSRPGVLPGHYYQVARVADSDMRQGGEGQARDRITCESRVAKTET